MSIDPEDPRLTAYALGELEENERIELERMLSESDEARRIVEEVRETASLLSSTFADEMAPGLSPNHWKAIESEIAMPSTVPFGQDSPLPWKKWAGYGIAASMLVGVGASAGWLAATGTNHGKADVQVAIAPRLPDPPATGGQIVTPDFDGPGRDKNWAVSPPMPAPVAVPGAAENFAFMAPAPPAAVTATAPAPLAVAPTGPVAEPIAPSKAGYGMGGMGGGGRSGADVTLGRPATAGARASGSNDDGQRNLYARVESAKPAAKPGDQAGKAGDQPAKQEDQTSRFFAQKNGDPAALGMLGEYNFREAELRRGETEKSVVDRSNARIRNRNDPTVVARSTTEPALQPATDGLSTAAGADQSAGPGVYHKLSTRAGGEVVSPDAYGDGMPGLQTGRGAQAAKSSINRSGRMQQGQPTGPSRKEAAVAEVARVTELSKRASASNADFSKARKELADATFEEGATLRGRGAANQAKAGQTGGKPGDVLSKVEGQTTIVNLEAMPSAVKAKVAAKEAKTEGFDRHSVDEVALKQKLAKVDQKQKDVALRLQEDVSREKTDRIPILDPIPGEFGREGKQAIARSPLIKPMDGEAAKEVKEALVVGPQGANGNVQGLEPVQLADVAEVPGTEVYNKVEDNPFKPAVVEPLSTFSIDVDTASCANIRRFLMSENRLPPRDSVRIEEMVNYFPYDYKAPTNDKPENPPFSVAFEVARCPWNAENRLAKIGLKGKVDAERKVSSLTFLVDVSGSMDEANKLPLVQASLRMLCEQLGENDRVAIVVYAGAAGLVLDSTSGFRKHEIASAIDQLKAGGSTAGGAGINLAYEIAKKNFVKNGVNRVILATDGDFNVGVSDDKQLQTLITEKAKTGVFLTVLGFGTGNLKDAKMEQLADKGNGNCYYIDSLIEARKVLVEQMGGTLITVGKDVKIQVDFNPAKVGSYRLIGYENRVMAAQDFANDAKDAGEIGAGHTVTALYELTPPEKDIFPKDFESKYVRNELRDAKNGDAFTVRLRFKDPEGTTSRLIEQAASDDGKDFAAATEDFKFASSVAAFGMILRDSPHRGTATMNGLLEWAESGKGKDPSGYRKEFCDMVKKARDIMTSPTGPAVNPAK